MEDAFVLGFEAGLEKIAKKRKAKGSKDDEKKDRAGSYGKAVTRSGSLGALLGGAGGAAAGASVPKTLGSASTKFKRNKAGRITHAKTSHKPGTKYSGKRRLLHGAGGGAAGALVGGGLGALSGLIQRWKGGAD